MDDVMDLLWNGKYEEAILTCNDKLKMNPEDAECWYLRFLAQNENFAHPLDFILAEMDFNKALELTADDLKDSMNSCYTVLSALKEIPYLAALYLAIKGKNEDEITRLMELSLNDETTISVDLSPEFISDAADILLSDEVKSPDLYGMFYFLVVFHTGSSRLSKIVSKTSTGISLQTIRNYLADVKNHRLAREAEEAMRGMKPQLDELEEVLKSLPKTREDDLKGLDETYLNAKKEAEAEYQRRLSLIEEKYEKLTREKEEKYAKIYSAKSQEFEALKNAYNEKKDVLDELGIESSPRIFGNPGIGMMRGDLITMGKYQDEEIHWRVLFAGNGSALLLSERILDARGFDSKSNNYEKSALRKWLNGTFYNSFTPEEKKKILLANVDNSLHSSGDTRNRFICADTQDYFFPLSYEQVMEFLKTEKERICYGTDHAIKCGLWTYGEKGPGNWWLRSPYFNMTDGVQIVGTGGNIFYNSATNNIAGVRPACWIKL